MQCSNRWLVGTLFITALQLAACGQTPAPAASHSQPAKVEHVAGSDLSSVVLTPEAAKRIDIQTAAVREELLTRKRMVGGELVALPVASDTITAPGVGTIMAPDGAGIPAAGTRFSAGQTILRLARPAPVAPTAAPASTRRAAPTAAARPAATASASSNQAEPFVELKAPRDSVLTRLLVAPGQAVEAGQALFEIADPSTVLVRVPLTESDLATVDRGQSARVVPLAGDTTAPGVTVTLVEQPAVDDQKAASKALYYLLDPAAQGLAAGQRVRVELALKGSGAQQKIVPYAAVIYDLHGDTWAYTNPKPLTFIRHHINVDYIQGDLAILTEGPPAGTTIVTVGGAELFGTEFGVGH